MTEPTLADQLESMIGKIAACLHGDQKTEGFTQSEWRVLSALASTPTISLGELSLHVQATTSSTSKILRKLSVLGLAEWRRALTNRRQYEISITRRGKDAHEIISQKTKSETRQALDKMLNQDLMLAIQILAQCLPTCHQQAD